MKKLVTVTQTELIKDLRDNKDITFLYPLKSFCVGFDKYFEIEAIDDFILINRILNDEELDELDYLLHSNKNIKGIVFDDLGVLEIIEDLDITKILLLDHIATNVISINHYLDYVDSIVVSSDLSKDEIEYIVKNAKKSVVLTVFDLKKLMYSRRKLLSNYTDYHGLDTINNVKTKLEEKPFIIKEDELGTSFYIGKYYNGLELLNLDNVAYYWYNLIGMNTIDAIDVIINEKVNVESDNGFLDKKTIYKLKDDKND